MVGNKTKNIGWKLNEWMNMGYKNGGNIQRKNGGEILVTFKKNKRRKKFKFAWKLKKIKMPGKFCENKKQKGIIIKSRNFWDFQIITAVNQTEKLGEYSITEWK